MGLSSQSAESAKVRERNETNRVTILKNKFTTEEERQVEEGSFE